MTSFNSSIDTVIIGTAYPDLGLFLNDYLDCLESQSCSDFDLLIANHGMVGLDEVLADRELTWKTFAVNGSISSNRRSLIRKALEMGYRKIIFTDCDDVFETNRVEVTQSILNNDHLVVNDLDIIDINRIENSPRYFSRRFSENEMIVADVLLGGNILGLSNTAARADVFDSCPALISGDSIAFDWYLWAVVLMAGHEAKFVSTTSTKYRIHSQNTAGLPQPLSELNVLRGVEVKKQHYELMSRLDSKYLGLAKEFQWLAKKIEDKISYKKYVSILEEYEVQNAIWWENIRTPSEVKFQ